MRFNKITVFTKALVRSALAFAALNLSALGALAAPSTEMSLAYPIPFEGVGYRNLFQDARSGALAFEGRIGQSNWPISNRLNAGWHFAAIILGRAQSQAIASALEGGGSMRYRLSDANGMSFATDLGLSDVGAGKRYFGPFLRASYLLPFAATSTKVIGLQLAYSLQGTSAGAIHFVSLGLSFELLPGKPAAQ